MNAKIIGKINHFLKSEDGRVGVKAPLTLGIAGGSLLLAQSVLSPSAYAGNECSSDYDCDPGESCKRVCDGTMEKGNCDGTWVRKCVSS